MSCSAARAAEPAGSRSFSCRGTKASSTSATQPTFRQWWRTLIPGLPSLVVLAQQSSWGGAFPIAGKCVTVLLEAGTSTRYYKGTNPSRNLHSGQPIRNGPDWHPDEFFQEPSHGPVTGFRLELPRHKDLLYPSS